MLASAISLQAQTGSMMRQAAILLSEGKEKEARDLWLKVWNNDQASPFARIEAAGLLGESLFTSGIYENALKILDNTLVLADSIAPGMGATEILRYNYALHLTALGRYDEARKNIIANSNCKNSELHYRNIAHLAELESRTGNHNRAVDILDSLYSIMPADNAFDALRAAVLQNKGFISLESGDFAEAQRSLRKAFDMTEGLEHMITMSNLAMAESFNGDCLEAKDHIDASVKYFLKHLGKDSYDYINALRKKALIEGRCGAVSQANATSRQFISLEKERLLDELDAMSGNTRLNYWLREKPLLSSLFTIKGLDADILSDAAILRRQVSMLGMRDVDALRKNIGFSSKDVGKLLPKGGVLIQLIEYQNDSGQPVYDAIITSKDGKCKRIPLFSVEEIKNMPLSNGTTTLYNVVTSDNFDDINTLYSDSVISSKIWKPIMDNLSANTSTIYFVPEGIFHLWGIENMPLPEGMPELQRLSGVTALKDISKPYTLPDGHLTLVAGGLNYSNSETGETTENPDHTAYALLVKTLGASPGANIFAPLLATRLEADSVAALLGKLSALHELHEDDFKRLAPAASLIHLATHGYTINSGIGEPPRFIADTIAIDMSLLLSGIALSGANYAGTTDNIAEDGILSAREIATLDLKGVDMVVLSACQTGRGNITDEGVSGLIRALKMAGVRTIVASLWEVDDNATRLFMQNFYREIAEGNTLNKAFAIAREKVAKTEHRNRIRSFDAGKMHRVRSNDERVSYPYSTPYMNSAFILIN